jgi:16S rRNA G1207 methylase RsmC
LASSRPAAQVVCWFLDEVRRRLAVEYGQPRPANLQLICEPDFPPGAIDLALLSCPKNGEAELTRELLQTAVQRLRIGGTLIASVDFSRDSWLGGQMDALLAKVSVRRFDDATVYLAKKTQELKKIRDFQAEFAYRDHGRLIKVTTRPGVFAHRRLDVGARRLLDAVSNCDGLRVLDIGCGSGSVGLGIAARSPTASVHAIDSNARAVACAIANVELNSLDNMTVELDGDGSSVASGKFDLVLANPPYYANHSIAEKFVETAHHGLQGGGLVPREPRGWLG